MANLGQPDAFAACQEALNTLFAWTHDLRGLHYLLLTGTCAFFPSSLWTGQDVVDLSCDERFVALLGYTAAELKQFFEPQLKAVAERRQLSEAELMAELERHCGGYSFDGATRLYCPAAVNQFMEGPETAGDDCVMQSAAALIAPYLGQLRLKPNYWEQAGAETLVLRRSELLGSNDYRQLKLTPLLVQLGLMTFKEDLDPGESSDFMHGYACGFTNAAAEHCCKQLVR